MPDLICEIWRDNDDGSTSGSQVTEQGDRLRRVVSPNSTLLWTYAAPSGFAVFRMYNEWLGFEPCMAPDGIDVHFFTEAEAEEQRSYLAVRDVS